MKDYGSGISHPKVVFVKRPYVCKSGVVFGYKYLTDDFCFVIPFISYLGFRKDIRNDF